MSSRQAKRRTSATDAANLRRLFASLRMISFTAANSESLDLLQCSRRDVLPIVGALKADLPASLIGALHCGLQLRRPRRYSQHAPARSIKGSIPRGRPSVEDFHAFEFRCVLQATDLFAHLVRARISPRRHYHGHRGIVRPPEVAITNAPIDGCLEHFDQ